MPYIYFASKAEDSRAREVSGRHRDELADAEIRKLVIHRRVGRQNYSRRCAEASAVQTHVKQGIRLAPGMEISYVVMDAKKWEVEPERTAAEFDAGYYGKLLEKAWEEVGLCLSASGSTGNEFRL